MKLTQRASAAVAVLTSVLVVASSTTVWAADVSPTVARITDTSVWTPPSPDPSGITYLPHKDQLLVSDAEVDEIAAPEPGQYQGKNLFAMSLTGTLRESGTTKTTTTGWSVEPTGLAYGGTSLYVVDDDKKSVFEITSAGGDGIYGTGDDTLRSSSGFKTSTFGNTDPEGVAYDTKRNELLLVNGQTGARFYRLTKGVNGIFDGVAPGGDDIATEVDLTRYGVIDPEGIAYDSVRDTVLVSSDGSKKIFELDRYGALMNTIDLAPMKAQNAADVVIAPSSDGSGGRSYYLVDRGLDNNSWPSENDGKVFEIKAELPEITNYLPVADAGVDQMLDLGETLTLTGAGLDSDTGDVLTYQWTVTGPAGVTMATPTAAQTTATFTSTGDYVFRLTVTDPEGATGSDETKVKVLTPGAARDVALPIVNGFDDAQEVLAGVNDNYTDVGSADNELGNDGPSTPEDVMTGLRFAGVPVPKGSEVVSAFIQFKVDEGSSGAAALTIVGEAADNPAAYVQGRNGNITARPRTTATVPWSPPTWTAPALTGGGAAGPGQATPDLRPIIQEIVNRPGWQKGNALAFMVSGTGRRTAEAKDGTTPPVLMLKFKTPASAPVPPTPVPPAPNPPTQSGPVLTASPSDSLLRVGRTTTVTATMKPAEAGHPVKLQVRRAAGWADVATRTVSAGAASVAKFPVTSTTSATMQYRFVAPAYGSSTEAVSNTVSVSFYKTTIVRVRADAEVVKLRNTGVVSVNLAGWVLKNKKNGRKVKLPSFTLRPGKVVLIHTDDGATTRKHLYLDVRDMWGRAGKAVLKDRSGAFATRLRY